MPFKFSVQSKRQVFADVMSLVNDAPVDLEGEPAWLAFVPPGTLPAPSDWIVAHWSETLIDGAPAQVISVTVGPNDGNPPGVDLTLGPATYALHAKVITPTEMFADEVDTVTVTGANKRVLVVSVAEMSDYMGYPFRPEQIQAVFDRISEIQGEAEDFLRADLTIQQWTETYTVPLDGASPFVSPYIGFDYVNLYPDSEMMNLGWSHGQVLLEHWPVKAWIALAVNNAVALSAAGITAPVTYTPGTATVTDNQTGAVGTITAINGSTQPFAANGVINNLSIHAGSGAFNVGDPITLDDGSGHTVQGIIAVGGVAPNTTSQVTVGTGSFNPHEPVWVPITPPSFPEPLPLFAPGTQVQVTYLAGHDGPNIETIKSTIKRAAARELTNRLDDAVGLKGMSVNRIPDPGGQQAVAPGLTKADMQRISRYKNYMILG